MSKKTRSTLITPSKPTSSKKREPTPLVAYVWTAGLGLAGYLIARIGLDGFPHPVHWASGLGSGAVGYGIGWLWYRWRGDILP
jgi:hypothetical protein